MPFDDGPRCGGGPESSLRSTESGPLRRGRFSFGTKPPGRRDRSRPPASVGWTHGEGEGGGRPVQLHRVRLHRRDAGSGSAPAARRSGRSSRRSSARSRAAQAPPKPLLRLVDVEVEEAARISTGVPELDRVLGGGLVPASLVLARRRAGRRQVDAAPHARSRRSRATRRGAARHRRGVGRAGQAARRAARRSGERRDPRGDGARDGLRDAAGRSGPTSA